jgi:hypothetical protein
MLDKWSRGRMKAKAAARDYGFRDPRRSSVHMLSKAFRKWASCEK